MGLVCTIEDLDDRGFDTEEGISMCAGDEEIYLEVLETALDEGREKVPFIKQLAEEKEYEKYGIEVHGLKNAMKSIGASDLSEHAKAHEFAVKEGNFSYVDEDVELLLTEYNQILDAIEELMQNQ